MPESVKRIFARMAASADDDAYISAICDLCPDEMEESDWSYKVENFKVMFKDFFGVSWDSTMPYPD